MCFQLGELGLVQRLILVKKVGRLGLDIFNSTRITQKILSEVQFEAVLRDVSVRVPKTDILPSQVHQQLARLQVERLRHWVASNVQVRLVRDQVLLISEVEILNAIIVRIVAVSN